MEIVHEKSVIDSVTEESLLEMINYILDSKFDVIIGGGGGRIIDLAKYLGKETSLPVISIPTLLSSDAISSPISVLNVGDTYRSLGTTIPMGVIVDIEIIQNSPKKTILAGLGDLISNISASYDWILAHNVIGERIDSFARLLAYSPAVSLLRKQECFSSVKDQCFIEELAYGLVMSGIAMNAARSSRPASGSEHNISHALDRILGFGEIFHGIQVGFATILTTYLQRQTDKHEQILDLYHTFKFPTRFTELGISKEVFMEAIKIAPNIRRRFTILNQYSFEETSDAIEKLY